MRFCSGLLRTDVTETASGHGEQTTVRLYTRRKQRTR
jgi:hypothetical protein